MLGFLSDALIGAFIPETKRGWAILGITFAIVLLAILGVAAAIFEWWLILT